MAVMQNMSSWFCCFTMMIWSVHARRLPPDPSLRLPPKDVNLFFHMSQLAVGKSIAFQPAIKAGLQRPPWIEMCEAGEGDARACMCMDEMEKLARSILGSYLVEVVKGGGMALGDGVIKGVRRLGSEKTRRSMMCEKGMMGRWMCMDMKEMAFHKIEVIIGERDADDDVLVVHCYNKTWCEWVKGERMVWMSNKDDDDDEKEMHVHENATWMNQKWHHHHDHFAKHIAEDFLWNGNELPGKTLHYKSTHKRHGFFGGKGKRVEELDIGNGNSNMNNNGKNLNDGNEGLSRGRMEGGSMGGEMNSNPSAAGATPNGGMDQSMAESGGNGGASNDESATPGGTSNTGGTPNTGGST